MHPLRGDAIFAFRVAAAAQNVGGLRLTFAVGAAILAPRLGVAMTTGMCAFFWLVHKAPYKLDRSGKNRFRESTRPRAICGPRSNPSRRRRFGTDCGTGPQLEPSPTRRARWFLASRSNFRISATGAVRSATTNSAAIHLSACSLNVPFPLLVIRSLAQVNVFFNPAPRNRANLFQ